MTYSYYFVLFGCKITYFIYLQQENVRKSIPRLTNFNHYTI